MRRVRDEDKVKCLELLSDHGLHTSSEIESVTGNWFVPDIIRHLKAEGHNIIGKRIGGVRYCYELLRKPVEQQESLFK